MIAMKNGFKLTISPVRASLRASARASVTAGIGIAAISAVIWGYGGGLIAPAAGIAQSLASHNSNAPVDYTANRIELQDKQNRVLLSGNVDITQGGLRLSAANMTVAYRNVGGIEIDRIDATGGVIVTKGTERASGNVGIYDFDRRIITLVGNVALRQAGNTLNGGRLVIDLRTGRSSVDGQAASGPAGATSTGSNGRVNGRFTVPKR